MEGARIVSRVSARVKEGKINLFTRRGRRVEERQGSGCQILVEEGCGQDRRWWR